jgi:predicted ATPase/DNA-binding SARP family transcriptional activator
LAGLLWPARPENAARNNLRHVLANLRQAIHDREAFPSFLLIDRETIALNPHSDCSVDTLDFRRLVGAATDRSLAAAPHLDCLEQAVSLYRGDFLEAFLLGDSPGFEEWILIRRENYRSQVLEALYELAEACLPRMEYNKVKACARRQIEIEPWREEAHRQLMRALALEGRRSEALSQYTACRDLLTRELGVGLSQATIQLFERIRDGDLSSEQVAWTTKPGIPIELQKAPDQAAPARKPHNLPRSLTSFIGREEEIGQVKQLLAEHCLVMLTGAGGVGKSRLALRVASEMLDDFRDGVWLVELAPLDNPAQVTTVASRALGLGEGPVQPTIAGLAAYLCNQQVLLVIDNCEHLIGACAELAYSLLQACPELKVLATSRVALGLAGEAVYRVPSLAFPDPERLPSPGDILDYAAVRLFVERARAVNHTFQVTESNRLPVARICQRLDGIPLALELAATHLDLLTAEQLASRLDGTFRLLTGGSRMALPRHQTLRATIDWSYQMLSNQERLLLQRLSVFAGGWTLEAVEGVCAGEGISSAEVLDLMTGLVNKSMSVAEHQTEAETRFRLLETVRQYAQEKLRQVGEEEKLRSRHCAYFLNLSEVARPHLKTGERLTWMRKLDADRENLFRAIRWAIDEENDALAGLRILCRLDRWWPPRGYLQQGLYWLRKGMAHWKDPPASLNPLRVEALCLLAHAETDREVAFSLIKQALALTGEPSFEDRNELGRALYTAGFLVRVWDRDGQAAVSYLDQSLQVYKEDVPGWSWERGLVLDEKSWAMYLLGNDAGAITCAEESWAILQKLGDHWLCDPLRVLGMIAMRQGDYPKARSYFEEALVQGAGVEVSWELDTLKLLGILERQQGHYIEAMTSLRAVILRSSQHYFYYLSIEFFREMAFTEIICSRGRPAPKAERHLLHAARLLGAAEAAQAIDYLRMFVYPKINYDPMVAELRAWLDPAKLAQAWTEGRTMPIERATAYALEYPLVG